MSPKEKYPSERRKASSDEVTTITIPYINFTDMTFSAETSIKEVVRSVPIATYFILGSCVASFYGTEDGGDMFL